MKVVVTGAAGMIGSNLLLGLNRLGITDIIAVDDLTDGSKYRNLLGAEISDYLDKSEFYPRFASGQFGRVDAVLHQGACSDTMEQDGKYMLENNYRHSKLLLDACLASGTQLIYASSAATYGDSEVFREEPRCEQPLNVYGYSKLLFDQIVRRHLPAPPSQIVGFRYFNVYGPREQHKGRMASVACHHFEQYKKSRCVKLFGEYGGYAPGMQTRDFVFIDDVVAVNLWALRHPACSGIFNLGTGRAQPFNDVALNVVNALRSLRGEAEASLDALVAAGEIAYIPFPDALRGKYQCHTEADLTRLRGAGCEHVFSDVSAGINRYVQWLESMMR